MTTIDDIYVAINPLPAMLSTKGKVNPVVELRIEANAGFCINVSWKKYGAYNEWEKDYHCFLGDSFDKAFVQALAFINGLPSAEQARLHAFMDKLGKLIDVGKTEGIAVDYLNPLLDSMKRLSENAIAYKTEPEPIPY